MGTKGYKKNYMDELRVILKKGWWVQISPLARVNPEAWILAIYKKGKKSWITDTCKSGFKSPDEAYKWAFKKIYNE